MDIPHLPRPRWRDAERELLLSLPVSPLDAACSCHSGQRMPSGRTPYEYARLFKNFSACVICSTADACL